MNVHILDDEPAMRRLVANIAEGAGYTAHEFASATEFRVALSTLDHGCVMLDINMPGCCGLELLEDLQRTAPAWPVIMVSGTTDVDDAITAFRRGAVQFLRKPFRRNDVVAALAAAAQVAEKRKADIQRQSRAGSIALTAREREVLGAMNSGEQSKTIAWKLGLSCRTIDMHRTNILNKLSARNATHAVVIARDLGLVAC